MKKKVIIWWTILGVLLVLIGFLGVRMIPGTTVRDDNVADKQVSKLNDSLYEYYTGEHSREFDLISSSNSDGKIVILVSLKNDKYKKNSVNNKFELTKVNYELASLQRKDKIYGAVQVVYEVDSTVVAESQNLYRPVKYVSSNDDTYDAL